MRPLGTSGLQCTSLGLGGAPLGDLFVNIPDSQAADTVDAAVATGLNYFDTAPWYGLGLSEHRMGMALRKHPRSSYSLSTKVGRTLDPVADPGSWRRGPWDHGLHFNVRYDYTYEGFRQQHRECLQRLGLGRMDCLVIHDMEEAEKDEPHKPHRQQLREGGGIRALQELRSVGAIRAFGVGMNGAEGRPEAEYRKWNQEYLDFLLDATSADGAKPLDFVLMAGCHTLLTHSAFLDGLLDTCQKRGIGVVIGGAFNSGILATGAVKGAVFDYEPASDEVLDRVRALEAVCKRHGVSLPAAALQYPLGHPAVATVIVGGITPFEVERAKACMDEEIPEAFWLQLLDDGLLPAGAPVPK